MEYLSTKMLMEAMNNTRHSNAMKSRLNANRVKYRRLILATLLICVSCLTGCADGNGGQQTDEIREYVLNKRSRKIHSADCPSVAQMNENNKLFVSDTLMNLLRCDYIVCRRCRAGIRQVGTNEPLNHLLHPNLYGNDIAITASYADYLEAIDEMSKWYVDHVPTYASKLQNEQYSEYDGVYTNYKEFQLKNHGKTTTHIVLSSDKSASSTSLLNSDTQILRGSENAAKNYLTCFKQIDFDRKIAYYPCNLLGQESDYNKPGDDCVRYMFAIFNLMDSQFTKKYATLTRSSYSKTNSHKLATDTEDIAYGMISLGFKVYDTEPQYVDVDKDDIAEGYIFPLDDRFRLRKGDILARNGHVHIYLGDGVSAEAENFGWGRVYRSYPQTYEIKVEKNDNGCRVSLINGAGSEEYYNRIYRYIGN